VVRLAFAVLPLLAVAASPLAAAAQQSLTLEQAVAMALRRGPSVAVARADSAAAYALVAQARAFPNPTATAQYTRSTPQYHFEVEQPMVLPWIRSARVSSTEGGLRSATFRLDLQRALVTRDVEAAYVLAAAAARRRDLSTQTASDALSLVDVARRRALAGDAAELEVSLARVAAGDAVNRAASDSLAAVSSLIDLQFLIGEPLDRVTVALSDSLALPDRRSAGDDTVPLAVAAARAEVQASESALALARRSRMPEPGLLVGFERHDPSGGEPGTLPLIGVALSVPLFNRGGGHVGEAQAGFDRARSALEMAERETAAAAASADRERVAARARVERDRELLGEAERVADLSRRAYEEGAFPLATVLEAQRSAREVQVQYVDDLAQARIAEADYVFATRSAEAR